MPIVAEKQHEEFQRLCVNLITELTGRPIGLSYRRNDSMENQIDDAFVISPKSWKRFESFCQYMHKDPQRKKRCMQNHEQRARRASGARSELCWAGLHNCTVTSKPDSGSNITFIGGEFIAEMELERAYERFERFAVDVGLSEADRQELRQRLDQVPRWSQQDIERFQSQLQQIINWYEAYESMKQDFELSVHNVAHEFLIHVTALNVECDLLEEDIVSSKKITRSLKERVKELHHKIKRLDDVVSNHLTFYQARPRFELRTIGPILYDAIDVYQSQALEKGVEFRVDLEKIDHRTQEVEMAPSHLKRAIHNLVQNAVKYSYFGHSTPSGTRSRYIRICGKTYGSNYKILIENYGIGIEEDEYQLVFERGYQGRLTANEFRSGSGNGLYFVKTIVDLHHGSITIHSTPYGPAYLTQVVVSLPLRQPVVEDDQYHE
jgi:signal transduction histidine kinase